jgi:hypothetical protein
MNSANFACTEFSDLSQQVSLDGIMLAVEDRVNPLQS